MERPNAAGRINRTLRFHAYGKRRTVPLGPVSRDEAERQLGFVLADVARGTCKPAEQAAPIVQVDVPTFHDYADRSWLLHEGHGELHGLRDRGPIDHDAYLFPTRTGRRQYECKVRDSTLGGAVKRANKNLAAKDLPPLPEHLTPHSLRRTFATVLYALGEAPPVIMAEMGHTSPDLALRVYAQAMRLSDDERDQLAGLVAGEKAHKGTKGKVVPIERARARAA